MSGNIRDHWAARWGQRVVGLLACLSAAAHALTPPPLPMGDINCDGAITAADCVAAALVSDDGARFPECAAADPHRDQPLSDADVLALLADVFDSLGPRWTPTPSASPTTSRTPTITATASPTARATASRTPTPTPSRSPTPVPTATSTATHTATPTPTSTLEPTHTPTITPTHPPTATRTPTQTPTPTGLAYRLSGRWFANWTNNICNLAGQSPIVLPDTTYQITAIDGRLDIQVVNGSRIGASLQPDSSGTVRFTYHEFAPVFCFGTAEELVFDYTFTFQLNGAGSASADWTYGMNANCAVCTVSDTAVLRRISGPG